MPQSRPPHLPPQSCRVDTHYRLRSLRWTVFLIAISFLSGTAAALSVVAWIAPSQLATVGYRQSIANGGRGDSVQQADPALILQVEQKIVTVFDRRKKTNKMFYTDKAAVGKAALLSSDGWAVIYYPSYVAGEEKNWEAVDDQKLYYSFEKAVYDKVADLLYLKIKGGSFRINSFADWRNMTVGRALWAVGADGWRAASLGELMNIESKGSLPIWWPLLFHSLPTAVVDGALLFSDSGEFVGVAGNGRAIPVWLISSQTGSLLEKQTVRYELVNWKGWMVNGVEWEGKWKSLNGFYVSEASGAPANKSVKVGDVIIKIAGEPITEGILSEKIFTAPEEFRVVVWRKGEEIELQVKKEIVKL